MADWTDFLQNLGYKLGIADPPTRTLQLPEHLNAEYPSASDAALARQSGFGYESGREGFYDGTKAKLQPVPAVGMEWEDIRRTARDAPVVAGNPATSDALARAGLAANRSAISGFGFDPAKLTLDQKSGPRLTVAGATFPDGTIWSSMAHEGNSVHEGIHNGIRKLMDDPLMPKDLRDWLQTPVWARGGETNMNEMVTREIMRSKMGNIEQRRLTAAGPIGDSQIATAKGLFSDPRSGHDKRLAQLEAFAADAVKRNRPYGGPR